ncbi:MAG: zinc ribbon domain-containing protein [Lachnospiraceae bacterium]|nr:zinc ribbon domain-containing protein [Lachnospiraceae bacterium]
MKCRNCGARIKADELTCPYCSYQNESAAKRRYMGKLREIRSGMEKLAEQPKKTLKYEIAVTMILTVAATAVAIGYGFLWDAFSRGNSDIEIRRQNREAQQKIEWKEENYPVLDELYAKQDFPALAEILSGRYDLEYECFYEWEHYALMDAIFDYQDIETFEELIRSEEGRVDEYRIRRALIGAMNLIYGYDESTRTYNGLDMLDEDRAILDTLAEAAKSVLHEYLKLLPEDIDEMYAEVGKDGYVSYSDCEIYSETLYEKLFAGKEER